MIKLWDYVLASERDGSADVTAERVIQVLQVRLDRRVRPARRDQGVIRVALGRSGHRVSLACRGRLATMPGLPGQLVRIYAEPETPTS